MATPRFPKPRLVLSKCLELEACRYNGVAIRAPLVTRLAAHVELVAVCPEVEIGLGVPRDPVRLVRVGAPEDPPHMVQPSSGKDLTEAMTSFSEEFLSAAGEVEGFLLKSRSPSCGIKDTKVFTPASGEHKGMPVDKGAGLFARAVLERFPDAAIEDEGRLTNFRIRHHFLVKLFTLARLRAVREGGAGGRMADLVRFHADHKHLLMAYHQTAMRAMGRLVANPDKRPFDAVFADYRKEMVRSLARPARYTSHVNVLMHAMGYFKGSLSSAEKEHFLGALDEYRTGRLPLSALLLTLQSWIARFGEDYLERQIYFEPYPRELLDLSDSGSDSRGSSPL